MRLAAEDTFSLAALALAVMAPAVIPSHVLGDGAIWLAYSLFAVSLAFVWGHCGLLSLGHAVYFGLGAYAMSVVTLGMVPGAPWLISTWAGLISAVIVAGASAWLLGLLFFAAKGLRGAFFGIVTLAVAVIAERLAVRSDLLGGLNGLMSVPPLNLGLNGGGAEIVDTMPLYYTLLVILALVIAGLRFLILSPFGLTLAAIRENELRVATLGHDVRALKVRAFALSGALAGLSGALFVVQFGFASPSLIGFPLSVDALIWVAVGGRGQLVAAALGAIGMRLIESRLSGGLGTLWPLVLGVIFMLSVIFFRDGLLGTAIKWLQQHKK